MNNNEIHYLDLERLQAPPRSAKRKAPRDSQVSKVYRSEWEMLGAARTTDSGIRWARRCNLSEARTLVNIMLGLPQVQELMKPGHDVSVRWAHGNTKNGKAVCKTRWRFNASEIHLTRDTACALLIVHEFTHAVLTSNKEVHYSIPAHGPEFCRLYLSLLKDAGFPEAANLLRAQYVKHRVRVARDLEVAIAASKKS